MTIEHVFCECTHAGISAKRDKMKREMEEWIEMEGEMDELGSYLGVGWRSLRKEGKAATREETEQSLWAVYRFIMGIEEWTGRL